MTKEELKIVVDNHRLWLNGEPNGARADLSGANLSRANLSGADLSGADLSRADLSRADLSGADLSGAVGIALHNNLHLLRGVIGKIRAWKYLIDGESPYKKAPYVVGQSYEFPDANEDEMELCAAGGNVASLKWCYQDQRKYENKTYIEVEFTAEDIAAIPYFGDGKFRVKRFAVIKAYTQDEVEKMLKINIDKAK